MLTLDQEECANFLSDCGLAMVLTVSLILSQLIPFIEKPLCDRTIKANCIFYS